MPVIDNSKNPRKLPDNHPLAQPRIWFGVKRPVPRKPEAPGENAKPASAAPSTDTAPSRSERDR